MYSSKYHLSIVSIVTIAMGLMGPIATFAAGPTGINFLSADHFAILTKTGISTTGATSIAGDIGVSPAAATYLTGFALNLPVGSVFANSPIVTGNVYAPDYSNPTPANMTSSVSDMETAYTDGVERTNPTATELGSGNIGGLTIAPGLYKWGTGLAIPTDVTLSGGANDVWIFQVAQNLNLSPAAHIVLSGGAQARNVFWVVGGQTTIGTTSVFNGNILDKTAIVLRTGAVLNGRAFAQTAVTLDANAISIPSGVSVVTAPAPIVVPILLETPTVSPVKVLSSVTVVQAPETILVPIAVPTISQTRTLIPTQVVSPVIVRNNETTTPIVPVTQAISASVPSFEREVRAITRNLGAGNIGKDVLALQNFLIARNQGPAARALGKVGRTSNFGVLTRAALAEFQGKVDIRPAVGYFGTSTRTYIKLH